MSARELSETNLRLEEEVAKKDQTIRTQNQKLVEFQERVECLEDEAKRTGNAVLQAQVARGEDVAEAAEAIQTIAAVKKMWQSVLSEKAYENVVQLLDMKTSLMQLEGVVKAVEAACQSLPSNMREAVSSDTGQVVASMGAIVTVLKDLLERFNDSERRNEEIRALERQALEEWRAHMRKM